MKSIHGCGSSCTVKMSELLAKLPAIEKIDVLAAKPPG
jgi:hypothetical protein